MLIFGEYFKTQSVYIIIIHQNAPNCTIFSKFSQGYICVQKDKNKKIRQPSFYLDHLKNPIFENCRYLGITISTKNSDLDLQGK